ncbi:hypothetical protein CROQUDRAFT_656971 [Cronartium quercuum f. sp. fusiforme G11]|uniref:Uncharacterized protein n=1 Tax=Cronartium quercuum f. sp. fusiforme G11 TaxID=708437 RepID=A0A9P6TCI2_9BASI|nr:hypothetical protein CROQUDRAFT_656971 [Cronartium quercuum f. sp. fusiforme G11]
MALSNSSAPGPPALISYIDSLPSTVNPFKAASQWLTETQSVATAYDPPWARRVMNVIMAAYILLLSLTLSLLFLRVSNGHFSIGSVTRHGLWRPNAPNCMAILMGIFAILTIASLSLQITSVGNHDNYAKILALYGIKFITIYLSAWVFCWACACQCALASWERPWYDLVQRPDPSSRVIKTSSVVCWMVNLVVPGVAITSTAIITWSFVMGQVAYQNLQRTLQAAHSSLEKASYNYDPKTYQMADFLEALKPAQPIPMILGRLNFWYRFSGIMWLTFLVLFLVIYTPLLLATPRAMRRQAEAHLSSNIIGPPSSMEVRQKRPLFNWRRPMGNTNIEYAILLMMGWFVELASLSYVPMIAWQVSFDSLEYLNSEAFVIVANIGAHGFVSLTSNMVMVMAILQTRRLLTRSSGASTSHISSGLHSLRCSAKPPHHLLDQGMGSAETSDGFTKGSLLAIPEPVAQLSPSPLKPFHFPLTPKK